MTETEDQRQRKLLARDNIAQLPTDYKLDLNLGLSMIGVFFIMRDGRMEEEAHVNDPTTLAETVAMSMARTGARWAVYPDGQLWALTGKGKTRHYPSKEAAEMVAIHRG